MVSPDTVQVRVPAVVQVLDVGVEVTVYVVTAAPPVAAAAHVTRALALPEMAVGVPGWPGVVEGMAADDAVEAGPVPRRLVATTVNV